MDIQIITIQLMLLVAALVAMACRRFHFPYTVGLIIAGLMISLLNISLTLTLTKDIIYYTLLPPLIFEAAVSLHWVDIRKEMPILVLMSTAGLLLAVLVTAIGLHFIAGWSFIASGIFGILIAATDPVSVIATFKEIRVTGRLRLLVEAESLFNDGTAAVLFGLLVAIAQGGVPPTPFGLACDLSWVVGGGIFCGGLLALGLLYLAGKTTDHLVELTLTTVAAYGSFLLAEHLHCSGVLATLTAGLVVGNRGPLGAMSAKGREVSEAFWEYAAFVSNSLIFLLIGIHEAQQNFSAVWGSAIFAIGLVLLGRIAAIYPISSLFFRSSLKIPLPYQHIMVWGGLRGALALALALGLPPEIVFREQIISTAFAVVAFSVIAQGMTMTPLLRHFNLLPNPQGRHQADKS